MDFYDYRFDPLYNSTTTIENIRALVKYNVLKLKRYSVTHANIRTLLMLDNGLFENKYRAFLSKEGLESLEHRVDYYLSNYTEFELTRVLVTNSLPLDFLRDYIFEPQFTISFKVAKLKVVESFADIELKQCANI